LPTNTDLSPQGTLLCLGIFTFFMNYAHNSPFKELVPPISDLWNRPQYFFVAWKEVIVLHEKEKARLAYEHRMHSLDDVAKRRYFMKMHGIETKDPVSMVFGSGKEKSIEELEAEVMKTSPAVPLEAETQPEQKKKRFGIF
jgi:hypothetical protein